MLSDLSLDESIHSRAMEVSSRYRAAEAELVELLQQAEEHRIFVTRGHATLFAYVVNELGLSESVAYNLIAIARKARLMPELKAQLQSGAITLSNARKVAPVLAPGAPEANTEWLQKASELSSRQLERVKLVLGLSERQMLRLRRVQDLMCQSQQRAVTLEEVIGRMTGEYLQRHDPMEKAKRHQVKKGSVIYAQGPASERQGEGRDREVAKGAAPDGGDEEENQLTGTLKTPVTRQGNGTIQEPATKQESGASRKSVSTDWRRYQRERIPAAVLHQVNLRDERRCAQVLADGTRCKQSRWVEVHHKKPVSQGGENTLQNPITLYPAHHKYLHMALDSR